jgi:hypothetical protein
MVLQAFIDESYTANGAFVLAGYIATDEAWARFSKGWEALLPLARRNNRGTHQFKMSEMAHDLERVVPFYRVIEKYALMSLYCKIDMSDLARAKDRVWVEDRVLGWGPADDPYTFTTEHLFGWFYARRAARAFSEKLDKILSPDQQVDFYFDEHSKKSAILAGWEGFIESHADDEAKDIFGVTPRFEDDENFCRYKRQISGRGG